jgi:programmed cell death protein 5
MDNNSQDGGVPSDIQKKRSDDLSKRMAAEAQLKAIVNKVFEPAAISRLSNIRMSNEELYMQIVQFFVSAVQSGKLSGKVTEEQVKQVATKLLSTRRQTTIRRA